MLTVRLSKNAKTRIVPLDDSVAEAIGAYRERRDAARADFSCTRLIVGTGSRAMRIWTLDDLFMELRMVLLGRGEMWQRRPPRLMDLRHTFAVRTLLRWHEEGADVNAMMPVLARYLGHESISETYWKTFNRKNCLISVSRDGSLDTLMLALARKRVKGVVAL